MDSINESGGEAEALGLSVIKMFKALLPAKMKGKGAGVSEVDVLQSAVGPANVAG